MGPKARKILDEVGYNISQASLDAIMSIDRLEKRVAELEGSGPVPEKPAARKVEEKAVEHGPAENAGSAGPEDGEDGALHG